LLNFFKLFLDAHRAINKRELKIAAADLAAIKKKPAGSFHRAPWS
jgi:hypothetical protein